MSIQLKWLNASTTPPLRGIRSVPYERSRVASAPDPRESACPGTRRGPRTASRRGAFADERLDPVDDVLDLEARGVDLDRVRSRLHACRVALVAEAEVGGERVGADAGPLRDAPLLALLPVGDQEHLHLGAGSDDRADVASLDHDVPVAPELALPLAHHLA